MISLDIFLATLTGGVLSVLIAAYLTFGKLARFSSTLVSYAVGILLAAALLDLIPQALSAAPAHQVLGTVLAGMFIFFWLEKLAIWRHAHPAADSPHQTLPAGQIILVGDAIHNFVDGILIAAAFMHSTQLGWTTTFAVIAHEIPQEIGDFVILIETGYSRSKALLFNALSGSTSVLGGMAGLYAFKQIVWLTPYALAIAAASFLYIAIADLVPVLHRHSSLKMTSIQSGLMAVGVATVIVQIRFIGA